MIYTGILGTNYSQLGNIILGGFTQNINDIVDNSDLVNPDTVLTFLGEEWLVRRLSNRTMPATIPVQLAAQEEGFLARDSRNDDLVRTIAAGKIGVDNLPDWGPTYWETYRHFAQFDLSSYRFGAPTNAVLRYYVSSNVGIQRPARIMMIQDYSWSTEDNQDIWDLTQERLIADNVDTSVGWHSVSIPDDVIASQIGSNISFSFQPDTYDVGDWYFELNVVSKLEFTFTVDTDPPVYIGWGMGEGDATKSDTALFEELTFYDRRKAYIVAEGVGNSAVNTVEATMVNTGPNPPWIPGDELGITEVGLFDAPEGGNLLMHGVFEVIPLGPGDKIVFKFVLDPQ